MNKLRIVTMNGENWEKPANNSTEDLEKVIFKERGSTNPFVGILGSKREGVKDGTAWTMFHFYDLHQKKKVMGFVNTVLKNNLASIPIGSKVKITFLGKHKEKKYYMFDIAVDSSFTPVPNWEETLRKQLAEQNQKEMAAAGTQNPAQQVAPPAQQIQTPTPQFSAPLQQTPPPPSAFEAASTMGEFDDLPF